MIDQVLELYLRGRSTRYIAAKLSIGKSSVSNVLRDLQRVNLDLRLFHTIAITLGKNGSDIFKYARIIRVRGYLELNGISEDEMEVFVTEIVNACKWFCVSPHEIVEHWIKFSNFIGEYGKTPLEVRKKIEEKITLTENLEQEILDLNKKKVRCFLCRP